MSGTLALFLTALAEVLNSPVLVALFMIAVGIFLFCIYVIVSFAVVWFLANAWSGLENDFNNKEFDERAVLIILAAEGTAFWETLAALGSLLIGAGGSIASGVFNNLTVVLFMLLTFLVVVQWDTWHNILLQSMAEAYICFIAPVVRSLYLPLVNLAAIVIGALLPLLNAWRQTWSSVSTQALLDVIICGGGTIFAFFIEIFHFLVGNLGVPIGAAPPTGLLAAIVQWFELPQLNLSILDIGINFFPSGLALGNAIFSLTNATECLCAPVNEIVIVPFFVPFTTPFFAQALNGTLNTLPFPPFFVVFSPLFLTQGVMRPIIRTAANVQNESFTGGFAEEFSRPSFNSTFDTLSSVAVNTGSFVDSFTISLYVALDNIVSAIISSCATLPPWFNEGQCSDTQTGTCVADQCVIPMVNQVGCCLLAPPVGTGCDPGDTELACSTKGGVFFPGETCAPISDCHLGCCASEVNSAGSTAGLCTDDVSFIDCRGGATFFPTTSCAAISPSRITCLHQVPLNSISTTNEVVGTCSGSGDCAVPSCLCRYKADSQPAVNKTNDRTGFGECVPGTQQNTSATNPAGTCRKPTGVNVLPPVPGIATALVDFTINAGIQFLKYAFNIGWNIDLVVTSLDGLQFWSIQDTVGATVRAGGFATANIPFWLANFTIALGDELANGGTAMSLPISQHPIVRSMSSLTFAHRRQLDAYFETAASAADLAVEIVSTIFIVVGNLIIALVEAFISTIEFVIDQFFGTIYYSVATAIANGFPNPFAFGQKSFGDDATPGLHYFCVIGATSITQNGTDLPVGGTALFTEFVNNHSAITCNEQQELLQECRLVFARGLAFTTGDPPPESLAPDYITIVEPLLVPNIAQASLSCATTINNCAAYVFLAGPLPPDVVLPINQYRVLLEKYVDIVRALDPLVSTWFPGSDKLASNFFSSFFEPFVPILLVPIQALTHVVNIFTTGYLACIDIEGLLIAINNLSTAVTNILRIINNEVTSPDCASGLGARDSRILCAIAQLVDSFVGALTQSVLLIWHIIQVLIFILEGKLPFDALADTITFDGVAIYIYDASFAVFAILFQLIPFSVQCQPLINADNGCCVLPTKSGGFAVCVEAQTPSSCTEYLTSLPPSVADAFTGTSSVSLNQTCDAFMEPGSNPLCTTVEIAGVTIQYGCCQVGNPLFQRQASLCTENAIQSNDDVLDACPNISGEQHFFPDTTCTDAQTAPGGLQCPLQGGPAQTLLANAISTIVGDIIVAIPEILLGVIAEFINLLSQFVNGDLGLIAFSDLVSAFFTPIFVVLSDILIQLASVLGCAGATDAQIILIDIAQVVDTILAIGLQILTDLVEVVFLFVFGIIQIVTTFQFTLIELALQAFKNLVVDFLFAVFGSSIVCGVQDFLCALLLVDPAVLLFAENFLNLAVDQCRTLDCCNSQTPPTLGSVSLCVPGVIGNITSCDQVSPDQCPANIPQAANFPFAQNATFFTQQDVGHAKRAVGVDSSLPKPTAAFCGGFIAQMNLEKARKAAATGDAIAQACLKMALNNDEDAQLAEDRRSFRAALAAELDPYKRVASIAGQRIGEHWWTLRERARENLAREDASGRVRRHGHSNIHYPFRMGSLLAKEHGIRRTAQRKRTTPATRRHHLRSGRQVWKKHKTAIAHQTITDLLMIMMQSHRAFAVREEHVLIRKWMRRIYESAGPISEERRRNVLDAHHRPEAVARRSPLTKMAMRSIGFRIFVDALGQHIRRVTDPLKARVRAFLKRMKPIDARRKRSLELELASPRVQQAEQIKHKLARDAHAMKILTHLRTTPYFSLRYQHRFTNLPDRHGIMQVPRVQEFLGNDTLEALGALTCNDTTQIICTGCLIVDNLIGAAEAAFLGMEAFYPNTETGYLSYINISIAGFNNTLVFPQGTNVYTDRNKLTPFIFERLEHVLWFWFWNYTTFIDIVTSGATPGFNFVNQTQPTQLARAQTVGRVDYDNQIFTLFGPFIQPAVEFTEKISSALSGSVVVNTLINLYNVYVKCDYQGALQCESALLGIGLFDAFLNVLLISVLAAILLNQIFAGSFMIISLVILAVAYPLTLWIAYGASPLCTLPTLFPFPGLGMGIPGVPTCLPIDIYTLNAEIFPQCSPAIFTTLILPAAEAEASTTLCTSCGTAPPMNDCADAAGVLDGSDIFFYITGRYLSPAFNEFVASTFATVLPVLAGRAALYTPAYIQAGGQTLSDCVTILFADILTFAAIVAILGALVVVVISFLIFFLFSDFWLYWATILAANEMLIQMDAGFVHGTKVEKLAP